MDSAEIGYDVGGARPECTGEADRGVVPGTGVFPGIGVLVGSAMAVGVWVGTDLEALCLSSVCDLADGDGDFQPVNTA